MTLRTHPGNAQGKGAGRQSKLKLRDTDRPQFLSVSPEREEVDPGRKSSVQFPTIVKRFQRSFGTKLDLTHAAVVHLFALLLYIHYSFISADHNKTDEIKHAWKDCLEY